MMNEAALKALADSLGFDACRIAPADAPWEAGEHLETFVEAGHHGSMEWMETTLERRKAPTAMWAEAKSAVVVAMNYGPDHDPMETLEQADIGNISVYARGADYHDTLKKRLRQLASEFAKDTGEDVKIFVDTAPLMEKPLAMRAGLGWQGKHTNLVSREFGSWLFLGVMLTTAALEPDDAGEDHCGACRACLDICPTDAFPAPYKLDARRCISYLTIEHKGPIPAEFRKGMGNRIYGCDDCLAVCPWNKFARAASESAFHAKLHLQGPRLPDLAALSDADFREVFSGSPVKRIGRARFIRNVLIALGNTNDSANAIHVGSHLADLEPIVRGAAVWALSQLDKSAFEREKSDRLPAESDPEVREEWMTA